MQQISDLFIEPQSTFKMRFNFLSKQ